MKASKDSAKELRVYLYNDLPFITTFQNKNLIKKLLINIRANPNVVITDIKRQIEKIATNRSYSPFDVTIAIGNAGTRVANLIHKKANIFPNIVSFKISRYELPNGKFEISEKDLSPLLKYFKKNNFSKISIVDDTLYSGLTLKSVINCIPKMQRKDINIFLLQGLSSSIANFRSKYNVNVALEISGIPEIDVTIIKASGLFTKGAIRPENTTPLAFFQREKWMREWFPNNWKGIIKLCQKIEKIHKTN